VFLLRVSVFTTIDWRSSISAANCCSCARSGPLLSREELSVSKCLSISAEAKSLKAAFIFRMLCRENGSSKHRASGAPIVLLFYRSTPATTAFSRRRSLDMTGTDCRYARCRISLGSVSSSVSRLLHRNALRSACARPRPSAGLRLGCCVPPGPGAGTYVARPHSN
jgi:hypothetical protein